jgi:hypothetical protein
MRLVLRRLNRLENQFNPRVPKPRTRFRVVVHMKDVDAPVVRKLDREPSFGEPVLEPKIGAVGARVPSCLESEAKVPWFRNLGYTGARRSDWPGYDVVFRRPRVQQMDQATVDRLIAEAMERQ